MSVDNNDMRIAMFGGTFDPLHKGHLHIIEHICEYTNYTRVICVPTSQNPDKTTKPWASNDERLEMLRIATAGLPHIEILDFEVQKTEQSYTVDTVLMIRELYQMTEPIGVVIGSDLISAILSWKSVDVLVDLIELLIVPRPNYDIDSGADDVKKIFRYRILRDMELLDIESSYIRNSFYEHFDKIPAQLIPYIKAHNLYNSNEMRDYESKYSDLLRVIQSMISRQRYEHSMRVAYLSYRLAYRLTHRLEHSSAEYLEYAWLAGIAHDCARELREEDMYVLGKKSSEILGNIADVYLQEDMKKILYHGLAAVSILDAQHPLPQEVYAAIASHTLGYPTPNNLQKIVYVADTMEPSRNIWKERERVSLLETLSLDELVLLVVDTLEKHYHNLNKITINMRNYIRGLYEK